MDSGHHAVCAIRCTAGRLLSNANHPHHDMQEVESSVLSQAAMRSIGRYEMGWLQATYTQDAPDQAPKLAFVAQADEDEGTQGGIFIGGAPLPLHCHAHLQCVRCGSLHHGSV